MTKTTFATLDDHRNAMNQWFIVDASKHVMGRMAVTVAETLMGKHTPLYTPHINVGAGVIIINAAKAGVTGNKREAKIYRKWSGYPGGMYTRTLGDRLDTDSPALLKDTVRRMLPKTRMGKAMLKRLKVYAGPEHDHIAQRPVELKIPE